MQDKTTCRLGREGARSELSPRTQAKEGDVLGRIDPLVSEAGVDRPFSAADTAVLALHDETDRAGVTMIERVGVCAGRAAELARLNEGR